MTGPPPLGALRVCSVLFELPQLRGSRSPGQRECCCLQAGEAVRCEGTAEEFALLMVAAFVIALYPTFLLAGPAVLAAERA